MYKEQGQGIDAIYKGQSAKGPQVKKIERGSVQHYAGIRRHRDTTRNDANTGSSKLIVAGSLWFVAVKMFSPVGSKGKQSKVASLL